MNIINKTLLPIENLPEGEAILNISIYDVDNEVYLTGTELANAYSVSPLKPTYSIGETVSITINSYFGTVEERTFTRVVDQPITNLEFTIVGSIHQVVQQNATDYSYAWAYLYNSSDTSSVNQRLTSTNFVLEGWSNSMFDSTSRRWKLPDSSTTSKANLRFSSRQNQINVFYDDKVYIKQIVKWGGYRPTTYPYNNWKLPTNSTITMDQFYPSKIPSVWTSLSGILVTFPNATDIPAGWDVTNITNIRGIFSTTITDINTYPSRLLSKAYNVLTDLFRYKKLGVNVDLSLVDYSKATALGIFVGRNYYSEYYDKMLRKWVETTPETRSISVTIQAPYTAEGEVYRNILIERGWTITDLGLIAEHTTNKFIFKDATSGAIIPNEEVRITRRNVPMYLKVGDTAYYDFESDNYNTTTNRMFQTSAYGVTERTVLLYRKSRTLTVEVYPTDVPSTEYTITKTPNKSTYVAGDVVEVKLTSPTYENQTKMVTIGNEDATVVFDLEFNYTRINFTFLKGYISSTDLMEINIKGTIEIYLDGQLYRVYNNRNEVSVPRNKVLTYRVLSIDGYPQDYFKVAEGTIQIDDSGEQILERVYMMRHNLLIDVRTSEGSTITFEPNKPTYESKDVVLVSVSKEGYQTATHLVTMEGVNRTIDLYPINLTTGVMDIEYEYLDTTTEYGFLATPLEDEFNETYIFDVIVNGQVFRNKSSFTKQEILDLDAIRNGKVNIKVSTIVNVRDDDGYFLFPMLGSIYANNPNVAVKVWVNSLPNWYQRYSGLFNRVDVQYCVQPHNDSIKGFSNYFKTCQDLLSYIGKGEDSALNLSAIADWDFDRYDNYRRLFEGSYINFRPDRIIDFYSGSSGTNHYFDILKNGEIVDPAKYDDFLRISSTVPSIQFYMNMGRSKYTVDAVSYRNTITQRLELVDGGLIDPLTYKIKVNTNVEGATVTMSPQAQRYALGSTVAITVAKAGYETQVINHTVTKYIESNVVSVDLQVKTYSPTIIVKDENDNLVPNATITMSPNKVSYNLGEEIYVTATKDGYSIDERYHTIVDGDNIINMTLSDISMDITYTVGATGTAHMSFYLMNDIPVKVTNFDGTETLYDAAVELFQMVELSGSLAQEASRTIKIKPIGQGNVGIAYIALVDNGSSDPTNTIAINKWGNVRHANMLAYLFAPKPCYISHIAMIPNTSNFDYLFYGLDGFTSTSIHKPILLEGALSEWENVSIGSGVNMFASGSNLDIDPRGFDLENATDITNIFEGTTLAPINGQNAYDLWLIHLAENYLNKALSFKISMKYTSMGQSAKQELIDAGWSIQDLGFEIPNTLVVNTTPSDATVTLNPNKTNFNIGENVEVTISKNGYVTQVINHTIVQGVNTVSVVLELESTDMVMRYTKVGGTGLFTLYMSNPSTTITTKNVMTNATLSFTPTSSFTKRTLGNLSTTTITDKEVRLVQTTNPNATDTYVRSIEVPTVANGGKLDILSWGNFNYNVSLNSAILIQGKVGRIVPPKNTSLLSYFFNYVTNTDYSEADFSDWDGVQIQIAQRMFSYHTLLNFDPRMLDLTYATDIRNIFAGTTLAPINGQNAYDLWLIHLAQNYLNKNLTFTYGGKYTSAGASARAQLVSAGFTITDGGLES